MAPSWAMTAVMRGRWSCTGGIHVGGLGCRMWRVAVVGASSWLEKVCGVEARLAGWAWDAWLLLVGGVVAVFVCRVSGMLGGCGTFEAAVLVSLSWVLFLETIVPTVMVAATMNAAARTMNAVLLVFMGLASPLECLDVFLILG